MADDEELPGRIKNAVQISTEERATSIVASLAMARMKAWQGCIWPRSRRAGIPPECLHWYQAHEHATKKSGHADKLQVYKRVEFSDSQAALSPHRP
jgi:hypothetical protein